MVRHDLVYLKTMPTLFNNNLPSQIVEKLAGYIDSGIPLTLCRQDERSNDRLKVSFCVLHHQTKYRLMATCTHDNVFKITKPVLLTEIISMLPEKRSELLNFVEQIGLYHATAYVYGSYSYQYLTGEKYTHPTSDLDVLIDLPNALDVNKVVDNINILKNRLMFPIDGELSLPINNIIQQVSFNEIIATNNQGVGQLLVKHLHGVELIDKKFVIRNSTA